MNACKYKQDIDVFNFYSIELLHHIGVEKPDQTQIDQVERILKHIIKLAQQGELVTQSELSEILNKHIQESLNDPFFQENK